MEGQEFSAQMFAHIIPSLVKRGVDVPALFAGLPFTLEDMKDPKRRLAWKDAAIFIDRMSDAVGGLAAYEQMNAEFIVGSPVMRILAGAALDVRRLYVIGFERIARKIYSNIGFRVDLLPDGRIRMEAVIPAHQHGSLPLMWGTVGSLRAYPQLLGLPPASVEAEVTPHRLVALVTPPASNTLLARTERWLHTLVPRPAAPPDAIHDPVHDAALALDDTEVARAAVPVGQRLGAHTRLEDLAADLVDHLKTRFCAQHAALWARWPGKPALHLVFTWGPDDTRLRSVRPLLMGNQEVGRISADIPALLEGHRVPEFDALLPWVALAVNRCVAPQAPPETAAPPADRAASMQRARERWALTPQQERVVELLAGGAANKDVAQALDVSVKAVEFHVTNLLRRAGVQSRAELVSRFWTLD